MARRKPRKPPKQGPVTRYVLEDLAAQLLTRRAQRALEKTAEAPQPDLVVLAAAHLLSDGEAVDDDVDYGAVWDRQVATAITGCDTRRLVHGFLNRLPIYLTGTPSEVAQAVWMKTLHIEVLDVVEQVLGELDVNGQPRFVETEPDQFVPNPDFVEPG